MGLFFRSSFTGKCLVGLAIVPVVPTARLLVRRFLENTYQNGGMPKQIGYSHHYTAISNV